MQPIAADLVSIARDLRSQVARLRFSEPVTYVYNPLEYAWPCHEAYLQWFGRGRKQCVLVGMNPGPWGMVQTGVPFGDVEMVRDWMGIQGEVRRPPREHPKRSVQGFACTRREVSGRRLWGWARATFGAPERFFGTFFVLNYCPLCFLEARGRNRTPDKLPATERQDLFHVCDQALARAIGELRPRLVVGIGRFAARRASEVLRDVGTEVGAAPHPSPANPAANRGWRAQFEEMLLTLGVELPKVP